MLLRGTVLALLVLLCSAVRAQDLSSSVFLSEDELDEALRNGELTYEQYQNLKEIMQFGIDSVSQYLLDEIPNLMYLLDTDTTHSDLTEQDQTAGFASTTLLEEDSRSWYRSAVDLSPVEHWRLRMHVNRESSGIERVTARSLGYRNRTGLLRRVEMGSFTTRFGLGTVFGHRGKMLDFSEQIDGESFLFPDYGGYNGVLADVQAGSFVLHALGSMTRDDQHRISSAGLFIEDGRGSFRPGIILGVNQIAERGSGASVTIPMAALTSQMKYSQGSLAAELSRQGGKASSATSAVVEGRHRFESVEMRYAGWFYGEDFVDITAGSKSGPIYIRDSLETIRFGFNSRRTGQAGFMMKTDVPLSDDVSCTGALLYADAGKGRDRQQFSGSLIHHIDRDWQVQLEYLGKWQDQPQQVPASEVKQQWRLESRYDAATLRIRCYIGYYETDDEQHDRVSLFASVRYETNTGGRYQVWSNMGEISQDGITYWYLYGRGEWSLGRRVTTAAKLSNSYRRGADEQNATQFSVELAISL
ncbi:MAG: hypothetical protein NTW07_10015 [candidate division Zixibacteria bacterium]|nr:hypothetical protein [candidate division Zixibacteria bacterium]